MKNWKITLGLIALTAPAPFGAHASALLKPTSGSTQALTAKSLSIDTHLKGAFAQTTVTTVYANPNDNRIEADFLYSAPKGSVVTGFAYWYGKEKVVARVVEKERASRIYQYITARMRDPALVEMVGKNSFRARIFPIEAKTDLKIEVKLAQVLPATAKGAQWSYPLREETEEGALQNLSIHLQSDGGAISNIGAFRDGKLSVEKTNFSASDDIRATVLQEYSPLRSNLLAARDGGTDGFFALSLTNEAGLSHPRLTISGLKTYDLVAVPLDKLAAGQTYTVYGRYRGSGTAIVDLNGLKSKVEFPDLVEKNNVASMLWSTNRIEELSKLAKNRSLVIALSKRFGVPSKWTSWLAIPTEERSQFKKQMVASDRSDAARLYAQAIAQGDPARAASQKKAVIELTGQLEKIGRDYSSNEELLPLQNYLDEELKNVRRAVVEAKYGGATSKQRAQWQKWAHNLQKAGANDGAEGVEMPIYVVEDELRIASRLLTIEVEAGRGEGVKARSLEARLKTLADMPVAKGYGWSQDTFSGEQAQMRAQSLATEIAVDRLSNKPQLALEKAAQERLSRITKRFGLNAEVEIRTAINSIGTTKAEGFAREVVAAEQRGQSSTHRADLTRYARIMGVKPDDLLKPVRTEVLRQNYNVATDELTEEILAGRENSARAQQLAEQVKAMGQKSDDWWQKEAVNRAYNGRSHQLAFELEQEKAKPDPDNTRIDDLNNRLETVAPLVQNGSTDPEAYLQWEKSRIAAGEKEFSIENYRYRVAGVKPDDFRGGRYGAGDPLIAIEAPSDSRSVVAIMPDGTIKSLEWRAENRRWEANFDIPTSAIAGNYLVSVIVVQKDGTRRVVKLRYQVDGTAPQGKVDLASGAQSGTLHLDIAASDDVERVTAILPWNDRQALRRAGDGTFASTLPIPAEWQSKKFQVRFVLTDKAHNRTEMVVDWN